LGTVRLRALKYDAINFCQHVLSNFIQKLISPQQPLSTQHPIYHTLH